MTHEILFMQNSQLGVVQITCKYVYNYTLQCLKYFDFPFKIVTMNVHVFWTDEPTKRVTTLIRLHLVQLLQVQSDQCLHCLLYISCVVRKSVFRISDQV